MTIAAGGGFGGKPRPALVIQADEFQDLTTAVLVLFTSNLVEGGTFRPRFEPSETNGLRKPSELMVDILVTARRDRIGSVVGRLADDEMIRAERSLLVFLGFAG